MKKNKFLFIFLVCLFFCAGSFCFGEEFVHDGAGLLSESEFDSLNTQIHEIENSHNGDIGIYIVTVHSMRDYGYSNIERFSEYWYKDNDLGIGSEQNGILLILSMEERDYDIAAYGSNAHRAFTDYGKRKLADAALNYFGNNDWYYGFSAYLNKVDVFLTKAEEGTPVDVNSASKKNPYEDLYASILIALICSTAVGLIVVFVFKNNMNNIRIATQASDYVKYNKIKITEKQDLFSHNTVVAIPINTSDDKNNRGGFTGGGTTINSSGFSHSSGKF